MRTLLAMIGAAAMLCLFAVIVVALDIAGRDAKIAAGVCLGVLALVWIGDTLWRWKNSVR